MYHEQDPLVLWEQIAARLGNTERNVFIGSDLLCFALMNDNVFVKCSQAHSPVVFY